jgi:hypothetical protein
MLSVRELRQSGPLPICLAPASVAYVGLTSMASRSASTIISYRECKFIWPISPRAKRALDARWRKHENSQPPLAWPLSPSKDSMVPRAMVRERGIANQGRVGKMLIFQRRAQ